MEAEEQHGPSTRANSGARASHWKEISAAANDKLMAVLAEFTFNLNLHLTKMNESMDNFAVDVRNEIEQELREVKDVKKKMVEMKEIHRSMMTETESGFGNAGYERRKIVINMPT